jgi:hypothetical protein
MVLIFYPVRRAIRQPTNARRRAVKEAVNWRDESPDSVSRAEVDELTPDVLIRISPDGAGYFGGGLALR